MKPSIVILVLVAVSSIATGSAEAQPLGLGRLGRNPPGPWRYTRPLPRAYYYPYSSSYYYTYPNYYYTVPYSTYSSPIYSSPIYSTPSVDYSAPTTSPPVAANAVPVPGRAAVGGTFTLTNPPSNGGPIRYSLNNFTYTMNPGESQAVQLDRDWVITFDSGFNKTMRYRMEPGPYEFTVSPEAGWNVVRHVSAVPTGPGRLSPGELSPSDVNPALTAPLP